MGSTDELDLPYPEPTDPNDVPLYLQALAGQLEEVLLDRFIQSADARLSNARSPNGSAGGVLSGIYPAPGLADGAITSGLQFTASLRNGAANTPTLRSLGSGATQAAPGDHVHHAARSELVTPSSAGLGSFSFGKTFPTTPVVTASCQSVGYSVGIWSVSATGFTAYFRDANNNPVTTALRCLWIALPPT